MSSPRLRGAHTTPVGRRWHLRNARAVVPIRQGERGSYSGEDEDEDGDRESGNRGRGWGVGGGGGEAPTEGDHFLRRGSGYIVCSPWNAFRGPEGPRGGEARWR